MSFPVDLNDLRDGSVNVIDVIDYGITADGSDITAALQALLDSIPEPESIPGNLSRLYGTYKLRFPAKNGGKFLVSSTITVSKQVILSGDGPDGALIEYTGADARLFTLPSADRTRVIKGLCFKGGGIYIEGGSKLRTVVEDCIFSQVPGYCIETEAAFLVVGLSIRHNRFQRSIGAIKLGSVQQDDIEVINNYCLENEETDIISYATSTYFERNQFEIRRPMDGVSVANHDHPFMRIAAGGQHLVRNRFGSEDDGTYGPPRHTVIIGESNTVADATLITGVTLEDNDFLGAASGVGGPGADHARAFIYLTNPVTNLRIVDNKMQQPGEYALDAVAGLTEQAHGRIKWDNEVSGNHLGAVFGPNVTAYVDDRTAVPEFSARKSLIRSDDLTAWTQSGLTVARTAAGAGGEANGAWLLTRSAGGSAMIHNTTAAGEVTAGEYVYQVTAKSVSGQPVMRMMVYDTTNLRWVSNSDRVFRLGTEYQTFHVHFKTTSTVRVQAYIAHGVAGSEETAAEIAVLSAYLHRGKTPVEQLPTPDGSLANAHAPLQFGDVVIGQRVVGFRDAAPTSGYHNIGDIYFNTAPTAGGSIGWTCVAAGSPGTWKTWGVVSV